MSFPLVSIVIPMYNQKAEFLRPCLEGALNQTYDNIEIIISDNHSTNNASNILLEYSKSDTRIKIIKPENHLEMVDHFIFAASFAKGEYISFLSSDDLLYPECIKKAVMPLIENEHLAYSYCENAIIDTDGNRKFLIRGSNLKTGLYSSKKIAHRMYNNSEYWIIGSVIRNDIFKKVSFVKDVIVGDWVCGFQLLKYGDVAYINETLSAIRFHEREGAAKIDYSNKHIIHNKQRLEKHNYIINDPELLEKIALTRKEAISYRNNEILSCIIGLVRQHHKKSIDKKEIDEVFTFFTKNDQPKLSNFVMRYYKSKFTLYFTYLIGLFRRTKRLFN